MLEVDVNEPELLPVSCGYFFNIVRQLLLKQRKTMVRYLLLQTKGRAYDRLAKYIQYHSLSDLLVEMMQINVFYQAPKDQDETLSTVESSQDRSTLDDDDTSGVDSSRLEESPGKREAQRND